MASVAGRKRMTKKVSEHLLVFDINRIHKDVVFSMTINGDSTDDVHLESVTRRKASALSHTKVASSKKFQPIERATRSMRNTVSERFVY